jgi:hypothetical protein
MHGICYFNNCALIHIQTHRIWVRSTSNLKQCYRGCKNSEQQGYIGTLLQVGRELLNRRINQTTF